MKLNVGIPEIISYHIIILRFLYSKDNLSPDIYLLLTLVHKYFIKYLAAMSIPKLIFNCLVLSYFVFETCAIEVENCKKIIITQNAIVF